MMYKFDTLMTSQKAMLMFFKNTDSKYESALIGSKK